MALYTARGAVHAFLTAMSVALAALCCTAAYLLWTDSDSMVGAVIASVVAVPLIAIAVTRMRRSAARNDEPPIFPPAQCATR